MKAINSNILLELFFVVHEIPKVWREALKSGPNAWILQPVCET